MSVEDRLLVLLNQARRDGGDAALRDFAGLRSRLSSQAPDLHGEIQALAAALALGAPVRIAGAADSDSERASIAAEIARQERLSMSVVEPGLAAACIGGAGIGPAPTPTPTPPPPPPANPAGDAWAGDSIVVGAEPTTPESHKPGDDAWAGDSVAVGAQASSPSSPATQPPSLDKNAYPPPPQTAGPPPFAAPPPLAAPPPYAAPHPQPGPYQPPYGVGSYGAPPRAFYTQTWFFALVAAIIIAAAVGYTIWRNSGGTTVTDTPRPAPVPPGPGPQPQPQPRPQPVPLEAQPGGPVLTTDSNPPTLSLQTTSTGRAAVGFRVVSNAGPIDGVIVLPAGGWEGEALVLGSNGAGARARGTGRFRLEMVTEQNTPARVMAVSWSEDNVGAGDTQVVFLGRPGQSDVSPANSVLCLTDGTGTEMVGCGEVR